MFQWGPGFNPNAQKQTITHTWVRITGLSRVHATQDNLRHSQQYRYSSIYAWIQPLTSPWLIVVLVTMQEPSWKLTWQVNCVVGFWFSAKFFLSWLDWNMKSSQIFVLCASATGH